MKVGLYFTVNFRSIRKDNFTNIRLDNFRNSRRVNSHAVKKCKYSDLIKICIKKIVFRGKHPAPVDTCHVITGTRGHQTYVMQLLSSNLCHAASVIQLMSCSFCHQTYVMQLLSSNLCHAASVIQLMPCSFCHPTYVMQLLHIQRMPCSFCHSTSDIKLLSFNFCHSTYVIQLPSYTSCYEPLSCTFCHILSVIMCIFYIATSSLNFQHLLYMPLLSITL